VLRVVPNLRTLMEPAGILIVPALRSLPSHSCGFFKIFLVRDRLQPIKILKIDG